MERVQGEGGSAFRKFIFCLVMMSTFYRPGAFAAGPLEEVKEVTFLSYNLFLMAGPLGKIFYNSRRLPKMPAALKDFDILGLSEVTAGGTQTWLRKKMMKTHPFSITTTAVTGRFTLNGGLLLLSRFPILYQDKMVFKHRGRGLEGITAKGAVFARIEVDKERTVEVVLAHLQAGPKASDQSLRRKQLEEIRTFISGRHLPGLPLFILGDLNIKAQRAFEYDDLKRIMGEYRDLYSEVAREEGDLGYTYDGRENPSCWDNFQGRLDYILLWDPSGSFDFQDSTIEKFPLFPKPAPAEKGLFSKPKYLSDHYALKVRGLLKPTHANGR